MGTTIVPLDSAVHYKHQYTSTLHRNCFDEGCRCDMPEPGSGIPLSGSRSSRDLFPPIAMLARAGFDSWLGIRKQNEDPFSIKGLSPAQSTSRTGPWTKVKLGLLKRRAGKKICAQYYWLLSFFNLLAFLLLLLLRFLTK